MKHYTEKETGKDLREHFAPYAEPTVTVEFDNYREFLEGMDMTEAQKEEFLQAMLVIVANFVELGFGTHPAQDAGGQDIDMRSFATKAAFNTLSSEDDKSNKTEGDPAPEG